jgi:predicted phosphoribosyltransferase
VLVVRKIGAPGRPELAIGALARVGSQVSTYRNPTTTAAVGVDDHAFAQAAARARAELERRDQAFGTLEAPPLDGADVILVDDGLATGFHHVGRGIGGPPAEADPGRGGRPVAPASALQALRQVADAVVCRGCRPTSSRSVWRTPTSTSSATTTYAAFWFSSSRTRRAPLLVLFSLRCSNSVRTPVHATSASVPSVSRTRSA